MDGLNRYEHTYTLIMTAAPYRAAIKTAIRSKKLPRKPILTVLEPAVKSGIITTEAAQAIRDAETARLDAIQVDDFSQSEYLTL